MTTVLSKRECHDLKRFRLCQSVCYNEHGLVSDMARNGLWSFWLCLRVSFSEHGVVLNLARLGGILSFRRSDRPVPIHCGDDDQDSGSRQH